VLGWVFLLAFVGIFDFVKMSLEPFHYGSFGLSHILFFAFFASDAVYEIGTPAGQVGFAFKNLLCDTTGDFATCV